MEELGATQMLASHASLEKEFMICNLEGIDLHETNPWDLGRAFISWAGQHGRHSVRITEVGSRTILTMG